MDDTYTLLNTLLNLPLVALILARVGGLVAFAPFFGSGVIPVKVRALMAGMITLIILPAVGSQIVVPSTLGGLTAAIMSELMIGLVFGFGLVAIFAGLQLGGLMIGQQMGIALAHVFDPLFNEENSVLGQLYFWLAMVVFLIINGHHAVLGAVIDSFNTIPVGTFAITPAIVSELSGIVQITFTVGLQIAAPIILTIFLTTLALGFVARTVPQLNILSIGFPLRAMMGMVLTIVCVGAVVVVFVDALDEVMLRLSAILGL